MKLRPGGPTPDGAEVLDGSLFEISVISAFVGVERHAPVEHEEYLYSKVCVKM